MEGEGRVEGEGGWRGVEGGRREGVGGGGDAPAVLEGVVSAMVSR